MCFITVEPLRDGLNWYAYANNNPLRFVDPSGLMGDEAALAAAEAGVDSTYGHTMPSFEERKETGEYSPKEDFRIDVNDMNLMPVTYEGDTIGYGAEAEGRKAQLEEFDATKNSAAAGVLGTCSLGCSVAGVAALVVAPTAAPVFLGAATGLDFISAGLYASEGEFTSAALSVTSGIFSMVPSGVGFNPAANRYINSTTKRFIPKQQAISTGIRGFGTAAGLYTAGQVVPENN